MVKKIFKIALYSIRQWTAELRIVLLFIFMFLFIWNDLKRVGSFANLMDMNANPLVFSFYSNNVVKHLILLVGIIFLFSDVPFINKSQPYVFIRSRRSSWVLGQALYIVIAGAIYFFVLMGVSILVMLPNGTFATEGWGKIINTLAQTNAGKMADLQFGISEKIISSYSSWEAFVLTFLLNWGVAAFLGMLMFVVSLYFNRMLALVAAGIVVFFDLLIVNGLSYYFYYISPVTLSRLGCLDPKETSIIPSVIYPFIFYGISIVVLSVLLLFGIRKKPIEITSEI